MQRGPTLTLSVANDADLEWIHSCLADPAVHQPLGMAQPPTDAEVIRGTLRLHEHDLDVGQDTEKLTPTEFLILRGCDNNEPLGFWLHFGWDFPRDPVREVDLAVASGSFGGMARYFEAHVLMASQLFSGWARRLRWRVRQTGSRPLRWYGRLGARFVGSTDEPDPAGESRVHRHVYEVSKAEYLARLEAAGLALEQDFTDVALWQRLRTPPVA